MEQTFRPVLTIRIFGEEKCFGPGVAVLLRKVRELLNEADPDHFTVTLTYIGGMDDS